MNDRRTQEAQFEDALVEVLQQDYDLAVRHPRERMDRRRREVATLAFQFHHDRGGQSKVGTSVAGARDFSTVFTVDLTDEDDIARAVEDCETLALFLMEHLAETRESMLSEIAAGEVTYGRREDALLS